MKKKTLTVTIAALLVIVALIGGTLAYFTDETDTEVNAFTVGKVDIKLTEPAWNHPDGTTLMPGVSFAKDPTITVVDGSQDTYAFLKLEMNKYVSLINLMGVDAYKNGIGGLTGDYPGFINFVEHLASDNTLRDEVLGRWFAGIKHADWKVMNLDEIKAAVAGAADQSNPAKLTVILGYIGGTKGGVLSAGDAVTFMNAFGMPTTVTNSMFDGEDAYKIEGVSKSNFNTDKADFKMSFTAYAIQAAEIANIDDAYAAMFVKP